MKTDKDPVCNDSSEDLCTCVWVSDDGRYGMKYDGTAVGSRATFYTTSNYCYDGDTESLVRKCESNEQWNGEMIDEDKIVPGIE